MERTMAKEYTCPYSIAMTTYKDSGVDIDAGNAASRAAYEHAKSTFAARKGRLGAPVQDDGGFAGLLDMGDYYLAQNDDGTGSKMELAVALGKYDTLGYDLLAMVVDDAICAGAEVMSVSNTLDVHKVDPKMVDSLLGGLAKACKEQGIVIPGGEIAEVPDAVSEPVWNATSVGIVAKDRVLQPKNISAGDVVIALRSGVLRSNGFSLARKILKDAFGKNWHSQEWKDGTSWGEILLSPSILYHAALLSLLGRYGEERKVNVKGLAHITGGGVAENFRRILKHANVGAELTDLWAPHPAVAELVEIGKVPLEEAYRTWNMGNGMLMVVDKKDVDTSIAMLNKAGIDAKQCGTITKGSNIKIMAYNGAELTSV